LRRRLAKSAPPARIRIREIQLREIQLRETTSVKSKPGKLLKRYRVETDRHVDLASVDCADTGGIDKDDAERILGEDVKRLADLQARLYAEDKWALLIVLQGMDAAGKDGVVSHVMSGVNPQGCEVHSFKAPSVEELAHDFMWRATGRLPARGRIGIFNRSYYEDVLVVRIHPQLMKREKVPEKLIGKNVWQERFQDIRAFERHLVRNGTVVLKFFLHLSKEEQRRRFLDRLDVPAKRWKFSMDDVRERKHWDAYQAAYADMISATSRRGAPWYVVPADHKWFARLVVAAAVIEALDALDLHFPEVGAASLKEMRKVRAALAAEAPRKGR
jgi:PPK2 family polyphosphate:nucleotide phosphotransferase